MAWIELPLLAHFYYHFSNLKSPDTQKPNSAQIERHFTMPQKIKTHPINAELVMLHHGRSTNGRAWRA